MLKLEISYYRVIIIIIRRMLVSFIQGILFFLKIIFLHAEIFEFLSFFICLKILFFNVNKWARPPYVTHPS